MRLSFLYDLEHLLDSNEVAGLPRIDAVLVSPELFDDIRAAYHPADYQIEIKGSRSFRLRTMFGSLDIAPWPFLEGKDWRLASFHTLHETPTGTVSYAHPSFIKAGE